MLERKIIAGRRSCLTPQEESRVIAWSKDKGRKPTAPEALDYFLALPEQARGKCLWTEFAEILQAKGLVD